MRKAPAWPLVFVVLVFLALAGAVSVVNPLFEATDEIRHYRYVRHLAVRGTLPVQGAETVRSQSHHPPLYYALCALASAWVPSSHSPEYEQPLNPFWGYRNWEVGVDNKLQFLHRPAERFPFREGYLAALIPRWVNVLLGAATVGLTWLLSRQVWPGRPRLAWAAAALVAFNPQFLYLSAAMNNDVIAAVTGTAVLLLSVQVAQRGNDRRRLVLLGMAFGLALLAKFHLLILGGVIALALILGLRGHSGERRGARASCQLALQVGVVLGVAAALSGWWFLRNWQLYGDPTGLNKVNELWMGRPASGNWWALRQGLPYLWSSLWARFGYGQIPLPASIYQGVLVLCLLALAGYLFPRRSLFAIRYSLFGILLVTVVGFTAVVCYYILIQPAGPMGRFLFPALPALAVLLLGGLDRWPVLRDRSAWTAWGATLGMLALALVALGGYLWPAVRYPPQAKSAPGRRPEPVEGPPFRLGDVARVRSVDLYPAALLPGEPLFVTVVWEPLRTTERPYAVYVHLIDQADVLVAQRDTWPGLGRAPTTAWRPGQPFADTYRVDLPETTYTPNQASVRVGLYEPSLGRLPVFNPTGEPAGDGIAVGTVAIEPRPGPWPNAQQANFGDEVTLVGYTLEPRALHAEETFTLTLYWQPQRQLQHDYLVFAQVLDPTYNVWGSRDGTVPVWSPGEVVEDVRRITLLPDTPPGSYPIQVGLFHGETGRLPVIASGGHYLDERVLLGPVRVRE